MLKSLVPFFTMFAGPLGNLITNGITAGSAAFVTYAVAKGMDVSTATLVATSGAGFMAAVIQAGAGMIGVQINVVNTGDNGLKVTKASADAPTLTAPTK